MEIEEYFGYGENGVGNIAAGAVRIARMGARAKLWPGYHFGLVAVLTRAHTAARSLPKDEPTRRRHEYILLIIDQ